MIYSVKRDDMNFESKRVIMSSVSSRARRGRLAASPSRTTFNRDTAQPKYDRSIDSGCGYRNGFKMVNRGLNDFHFCSLKKGIADDGFGDDGFMPGS